MASTKDAEEGQPAPRRRAGGRRGTNSLNSSFTASCAIGDDKNSDDKVAPKGRIKSRRERGGSLGRSLSNSLNRSLNGIQRTEGRLSVSFSDSQGLSSEAIADILSGSGLEPDDQSDSSVSVKELMDEQEEAMEQRDGLGSLKGSTPLSPRSQRRMKRPQLTTIVSQRSMKFDLEDSDGE